MPKLGRAQSSQNFCRHHLLSKSCQMVEGDNVVSAKLNAAATRMNLDSHMRLTAEREDTAE